MDSELKSQGSRAGRQPVPVCVIPYASRDEEISLVDLWHIIAAHKSLVLLGFLVAITLAIIYGFLSESSYRAEANLLPPRQQHIQALMIDHHGYGELEIEQYTPEIVYQAFLRNLKSKGLRREFFEAHNLADYYLADNSQTDADIDHVFDKKFNGSMKVRADKQNDFFVVVGFSDPAPRLAAQRLKQFIDFANERTTQQLYSDVNVILQAKIKRIRDELSSKLKLAKQRRLDAITILKEGLRVAEALGIKDGGTFPRVMDKTPAGLVVNTVQVPLYMRGTNALKTEISVLESRKSEEPFINGFRDLQERLIFMQAVTIDVTSLSAVTIGDPARIPYRMEKPNKKMIAVLGVVFGIMAGIFLALIAEFLIYARREFS